MNNGGLAVQVGPWKNARFEPTESPLWSGGGVATG
jgi:hypothetical protein